MLPKTAPRFIINHVITERIATWADSRNHTCYTAIRWYRDIRHASRFESRCDFTQQHLHCERCGDLHIPYDKRSQAFVNERLSLRAWRSSLRTYFQLLHHYYCYMSIVFNELTYDVFSIQRATLPGVIFTRITSAV